MGMAASQARYLSLSARKTNTEYEGQQLNQQRLNLANQSADLFNQMLTMSVPTCPDSNDFTKLQYSWSDGINDEVISDFYQISVPNEDYNYVVTSYHYENVYTGQSKRMNAPEIQAAKRNMFTDKPNKQYQVKQLAYHAESMQGAGDDTYTLTVVRNGVESQHVFKRVDSTIDTVEEIDALTKRTTKATAGDKAYYEQAHTTVTPGVNPGDPDIVTVEPAKWGFDEEIKLKVRVPLDATTTPAWDSTKEMNDGSEDVTQYNMPYADVEVTIPAGCTKDATTGELTWNAAGTFTKIDFDDETQREQIEQLLASYGDKYDQNKSYFYVSTGQKDAAGNDIYAFICGEEMDAAKGSQGDIAKVEVRAGDKNAYYTDGVSVLSGSELSAIDLTSANEADWLDEIFFHSVDNNPIYSNYQAVGNCKLNAVSLESYNSNEDMQIEIQQVIKDMKEGGNNVAYGNLSACFDPTTGEYLGGIYQFKMFDHMYYTTTSDLETAVKGAYREEATATNGIDSQHKLCYYTSTYLSTKIEDTKKALMETDGKGRFSSVKFEDDDTVYTLKCETITDDDAYQNAMNQYFYKQEKYDKAVSDINAKTEIIQAEDRELQLRLEQLGTEQTALQTEMEACQKVVSKNIEGSFKTFGG